jgi:hypothetical protein
MSEIATIRVRYTASGHEALINRDDFDPALHQVIEPDPTPLSHEAILSSPAHVVSRRRREG